METSRKGVVIPTSGGGYAGGGGGDYQNLDRSLPEHNFPIYCDLSDIGAVSILRVASRFTGHKPVMGTGGYGLVGCREVGGVERAEKTDTEEAGEDTKEDNHND